MAKPIKDKEDDARLMYFDLKKLWLIIYVPAA